MGAVCGSVTHILQGQAGSLLLLVVLESRVVFPVGSGCIREGQVFGASFNLYIVMISTQNASAVRIPIASYTC